MFQTESTRQKLRRAILEEKAGISLVVLKKPLYTEVPLQTEGDPFDQAEDETLPPQVRKGKKLEDSKIELDPVENKTHLKENQPKNKKKRKESQEKEMTETRQEEINLDANCNKKTEDRQSKAKKEDKGLEEKVKKNQLEHKEQDNTEHGSKSKKEESTKKVKPLEKRVEGKKVMREENKKKENMDKEENISEMVEDTNSRNTKVWNSYPIILESL